MRNRRKDLNSHGRFEFFGPFNTRVKDEVTQQRQKHPYGDAGGGNSAQLFDNFFCIWRDSSGLLDCSNIVSTGGSERSIQLDLIKMPLVKNHIVLQILSRLLQLTNRVFDP